MVAEPRVSSSRVASCAADELLARMMIGHTVMRKASAAASQPRHHSHPPRHEPQEPNSNEQPNGAYDDGSTQSGGVPAQPAVVARRVRDGGHRSSVADRITTCHAIRSHPERQPTSWLATSEPR